MKRNLFRALRGVALSWALVLLGGCAFGNKITYSGARPDLALQGDKSVAVAVHDQRPYVLAGDKGPQFVGLSRSMYGIPYNVNTPNDVPLADEMTKVIADALAARGFKTTAVRIAFNQSRHAAQEMMQQAGTERGVLLTLKQWETDTYFGTSLEYDVRLTVFDRDGKELANADFKGDDDIGKMKPALAFQRRVEDWFAKPEIVAALR